MKNAIIAVLAIAVAGLLAVHFLHKTKGGGEIPPGAKAGDEVVAGGVTNIVVEVIRTVDGKEEKTLELAPKERTVERKPLEPEATKRLHTGPVVVASLFEASGLAEHAQYGARTRGAYYYATTVRARSEVTEKQEKPDGSVHVVEKRTFLQAQDHLALSDLDVALDLSTLPVRETQRYVNEACLLVAGIAGLIPHPIAQGVAKGAKITHATANAAFGALYALDGTSVRGLLGDFGVEVPENVEEYFNKRVSEWAEKKIAPVHSMLQSIEGKSYFITYTQDAAGKPLKVDFRHEAGEPISAAEWEILRSANAFLDANVVRNTQCEVGDRWTVWADEAQEVFGMAADGEADGKLRVVRDADQENGDWTLRIEPSEITYRGAGGHGKLEVHDGTGLVDAENASVKSLQTTATGDLGMLNKKRHWMLFDFVKKTEGNAAMRFTLAVEPAAGEP